MVILQFSQHNGKLQLTDQKQGTYLVIPIYDLPPYRDNTRETHDTDPCGERWRRGYRDVCGVVPMCPDIGDMPGGGVTGKGEQSRQALKTLHVQALEVQYIHNEGGPITTNMV